ncbi:MAG: serine/threonine protein kinase, partial [Acidobacteria bacterium]
MGLGGRYEILEECGEGTSGVVFRARERATGREVALKVLRCDDGVVPAERIEQLRREGELLTRLDHPGIVRVLDVAVDEDGACLVTELVDGPSVATLLRTRGRLSIAESVSIVAQAARALGAAHARGIVHGDVKPANLLLAEGGRVLLADFGLARDGSEATGPRARDAATPAYAAPERLHGGSWGPAADIYALGVVLWECLTGTRPAPASGTGADVAADSPPDVPAPLVALCRRALSEDPAQRPHDALAFARELESIATAGDGEGLPALPAPARVPLESPRERTRAVDGRAARGTPVAVLAGAATGALLLAAAALAPSPAEGPPAGIVRPARAVPAPAAAPEAGPARPSAETPAPDRAVARATQPAARRAAPRRAARASRPPATAPRR